MNCLTEQSLPWCYSSDLVIITPVLSSLLRSGGMACLCRVEHSQILLREKTPAVSVLLMVCMGEVSLDD